MTGAAWMRYECRDSRAWGRERSLAGKIGREQGTETMEDDLRPEGHSAAPFNLPKALEIENRTCHTGRCPNKWYCCQIVFQMQRLLESSCNTDPGSPWSIRFTWEPNFWTKQLASLGELWPLSCQLRISIGNLLWFLGGSAYAQEKVHSEPASDHGVSHQTFSWAEVGRIGYIMVVWDSNASWNISFLLCANVAPFTLASLLKRWQDSDPPLLNAVWHFRWTCLCGDTVHICVGTSYTLLLGAEVQTED